MLSGLAFLGPIRYSRQAVGPPPEGVASFERLSSAWKKVLAEKTFPWYHVLGSSFEQLRDGKLYNPERQNVIA
jgi:hypothetical protein